jgi:hypothetical protein
MSKSPKIIAKLSLAKEETSGTLLPVAQHIVY